MTKTSYPSSQPIGGQQTDQAPGIILEIPRAKLQKFSKFPDLSTPVLDAPTSTMSLPTPSRTTGQADQSTPATRLDKTTPSTPDTKPAPLSTLYSAQRSGKLATEGKPVNSNGGTNDEVTTSTVIPAKPAKQTAEAPSSIYDNPIFWVALLAGTVVLYLLSNLLRTGEPNYNKHMKKQRDVPVDPDDSMKGRFKKSERFASHKPALVEDPTPDPKIDAEIIDQADNLITTTTYASAELVEDVGDFSSINEDQPADDEFEFDIDLNISDSDMFDDDEAKEIVSGISPIAGNQSSKRFKTVEDIVPATPHAETPAVAPSKEKSDFDIELEDAPASVNQEPNAEISPADSDAEFGFDIDDEDFFDDEVAAVDEDAITEENQEHAAEPIEIDSAEQELAEFNKTKDQEFGKISSSLESDDESLSEEAELAMASNETAKAAATSGSLFSRMFGRGKKKKQQLSDQTSTAANDAVGFSPAPSEPIEEDIVDLSEENITDVSDQIEELVSIEDASDDFDDLLFEDSDSELEINAPVENVAIPPTDSANNSADTSESPAPSLAEDGSDEFDFNFEDDELTDDPITNISDSDIPVPDTLLNSMTTAEPPAVDSIPVAATAPIDLPDSTNPAQIEALEADKRELVEQLNLSNEKAQNLSTELEQQVTANKTLESKLSDAEAELAKAQQLIQSAADQQATDQAALQAQLDDLTTSNSQLTEKLSAIETQSTADADALQSLDAAKESFAAERNQLTSELSQLKTEHEQSTNDLAQLKTQHESLVNEKTDLVTAQENLNTERDALASEVASLTSKIESLTVEQTSLQSQIEDLQGTVETQAAEIVSARETTPTAALVPAVAQAEPDEDIEDLKIRFQKRLKQEHRKRKAAQEQLAEAEEQRNEIARQLKSSRKDLAAVQEQQAGSNDPDDDSFALFDAPSAAPEVEALQQEIESLNKRVKKAELRAEAKTAVVEKLKSQLADKDA